MLLRSLLLLVAIAPIPADDKITRESAELTYHVALNAEGQVDVERTATLRSAQETHDDASQTSC